MDKSNGQPVTELRNVSQIEARGVLGEFGYKVEFSHDDNGRLRVIYAPNGRGKTNFLRGVDLLLTPSIESIQALVDLPIRQMRIEFESGGYVEMQRKSAFTGSYTVTASESPSAEPVSLAIDPSEFELRPHRRSWEGNDDFSDFNRTMSNITTGATLIADDRLRNADEARDSPRGEPNVWLARRRGVGIVTRLLERVERLFSQSAFAGLAQEKSFSGVYAEITKATLAGTHTLSASEAREALEAQLATLAESAAGYEHYGLLSLRQVHEISTQLRAARRNDAKLPTLHQILKPYLDSVQDRLEALDPALKKIDTFVTGVNKFLDRKELRFSTSNGISLVGGDKSRLNPDGLSSGERHLLLLMAQAMLSTVDRPVVVIDEPELSLGIEWQRQLLPELLRCTESAAVQFLIASHSLQVMNAVPHDDIIQPVDAQ